jgi:hypothetical protein
LSGLILGRQATTGNSSGLFISWFGLEFTLVKIKKIKINFLSRFINLIITSLCACALRRYDMNVIFQKQGGKNWFLPKENNANRFFWDSHWLEIWSNHFCPSMGPNGGSVATDSGQNLKIATGRGYRSTIL